MVVKFVRHLATRFLKSCSSVSKKENRIGRRARVVVKFSRSMSFSRRKGKITNLLPFYAFFGQRPGQFRTRTMGHVARAEAVANFGMSAALRPVLGAFQPSSRGTPTAQALSRVVGLSAFAWMRYLCIGLFSTSSPLCLADLHRFLGFFLSSSVSLLLAVVPHINRK